MIWVLVFTVLIGGAPRHVIVEPFPTLYTCQQAAGRVAMIPKSDPATCKLKEQRHA